MYLLDGVAEDRMANDFEGLWVMAFLQPYPMTFRKDRSPLIEWVI